MNFKYISIKNDCNNMLVISMNIRQLNNFIDFSTIYEQPKLTNFETEITPMPQSIVVSIDNKYVEVIDENNVNIQLKNKAVLIDGLSRIRNITNLDFALPVVIISNLHKKHIPQMYRILNTKMYQLSRSQSLDRYNVDFYETTVESFCYDVINALFVSNGYNKIFKKSDFKCNNVTMDTFIQQMKTLITNDEQEDNATLNKGIALKDNENLVFRKFLIDDNKALAMRILQNYFNATNENKTENEIKETMFDEFTRFSERAKIAFEIGSATKESFVNIIKNEK